MATKRSCFGVFVNTWNGTINDLHLWYRRGRSAEQRWHWNSLGHAAASERFQITYETGLGSDHAYWFCSFIDHNGKLWQVDKENFYCDIESEDEGNVVAFNVLSGARVLRVTMSDGDQCEQALA